MKGAEPALAELSPGGWDRLTGSQVKKRNTYPRSCDMPLENNKAEEVGKACWGLSRSWEKGRELAVQIVKAGGKALQGDRLVRSSHTKKPTRGSSVS